MKWILTLLILMVSCFGFDPNQDICGADGIDDLLGTWYQTSQRQTIVPGAYITDSTLWILERARLERGITSMDSLRVTKESHPGDVPFDPSKHSQVTLTLRYNTRESEPGLHLGYGDANFEIPNCDTLIVKWIDGYSYRLRKK